MHDEFEIEYAAKALAPFGLVYYAAASRCTTRSTSSRASRTAQGLHHPWRRDAAAEAMGRRYVMAWKPNPAFLLRVSENEGAIRAEIRRALAAAKRSGTSMDIVLKDISSVSGNPENLTAWERIAMEEVLAW